LTREPHTASGRRWVLLQKGVEDYGADTSGERLLGGA
jgi:hypothetical protein